MENSVDAAATEHFASNPSPAENEANCENNCKLHVPKDAEDSEAKRKYEPENFNCSSSEEDDADNLTSEQTILYGLSSEDVADLRKKLDEGFFQNYFSWTFWKKLHSNHGSTLGYTFGFLLILLLNYRWMLEEFADSTEGHSVAKTFVILFVIYSYSFITLGLEFIQLVFLILELYYPQRCKRLQESLNYVLSMHEKLKTLRSSKYFYTPIVVLWCILTAFMGSNLWKWFWWNHICKSYHDRTCRGSWLGQIVIKYRDEACYDGTASSMICERFVSYLPIMLFCVLFVFLGNVFMPLLNDRLSASYYPVSEKLESAFNLIDHLSEESNSTVDFNKQKKIFDCMDHGTTPTCPFTLEPEPEEVQKHEGILKKIVPAGLGVIVLLLVDWIIVKNIFP